MSDTFIDMPKVTQMLDAGWKVFICKNPLHSYTAKGKHPEDAVMARTRERLVELERENPNLSVRLAQTAEEFVDDFHFDERNGWLLTDDFTPEQALTRLAYKAVGGEII
jgi:hypothetical protein